MDDKIDREDWLKKQIDNRIDQIKALQSEIYELNEELNIILEIKRCKEEIEQIEDEIKKIQKQLDDDPISWSAAWEEARWDKNWHAVRIAEEHLREERYLRDKITDKYSDIWKIKQKIKELEEKLKEIYKKLLVEETEDKTPKKRKKK